MALNEAEFMLAVNHIAFSLFWQFIFEDGDSELPAQSAITKRRINLHFGDIWKHFVTSKFRADAAFNNHSRNMCQKK